MFNVGDIVYVCLEGGCNFHPELHYGSIGKVVHVFNGRVGVEFRGFIRRGHTCQVHGKYGKCWYVDAERLKHYGAEMPDVSIGTLI